MNLNKLMEIISSKGGKRIYIKALAANDNSKNQVYLGGSFDILNIFPVGEIYSDSSGDWKRNRFKALIDFSWITETGKFEKAPHAQLILYPKYPEVRFSGFLSGCKNAPSSLMTQRLEGRLLFLSVTDEGEIAGYVTRPDSELAGEINKNTKLELHGVFKVLNMPELSDNKQKLISKLKEIHNLEWIGSKRLDKDRNILPCKSQNCGGYTLEAELDITPNGFSEPDYLGWEIKQFSVNNFEKYKSKVITLMTPEPTNGFYVRKGIKDFINIYGYKDLRGRPDRKNFGGVHKVGIVNKRTKLRLELVGFDNYKNKILDSGGRIALIDESENEAASWSFASILKHWNRKHNQACYIPSLRRLNPKRQYYYGNIIILGIGTNFNLFLKAMNEGIVYYDPGIKMENISIKPKIKRRSQFRIKSGLLKNLYLAEEIIDLDNY